MSASVPGSTYHRARGHQHAHPAASTRRLAVALIIGALILVTEVVGAIMTGSLALVVDAGHVLTDTAGLAVALIASSLARRRPTDRRTYGFARAEVLAATLQAAVLLAVGLFVLVQAVEHLIVPPDVPSSGLLLFGVIGLAGNLASLAVLASARRSDFNLRAAFLETASDVLGSAAVIAAALVIGATSWTRADPVAAIVIGALILPRTFLLLRDTVAVLLESTPRGIDLDALRTHLLEVPHVEAVHDLHATQISSALPVLTAHVVVQSGCFSDGHAPDILDQLQRCVADHFPVSFEHSTFQLEPAVHAEHEADVHR